MEQAQSDDRATAEVTVSIVGALEQAHGETLRSASEALGRWHLAHYERLGAAEAERVVGRLLDLVEQTIRERRLDAMTAYGASLARERFEGGFQIAEVQTAFNVVEEAIWRAVLVRLPAEQLIESAGLVGTALGAGKDALACTWVSLASQQHVPSLDFTALFEGTSAG